MSHSHSNGGRTRSVNVRTNTATYFGAKGFRGDPANDPNTADVARASRICVLAFSSGSATSGAAPDR